MLLHFTVRATDINYLYMWSVSMQAYHSSADKLTRVLCFKLSIQAVAMNRK